MPQMMFTDRGVRALPIPAKDKQREVQYFENLKKGLSLVLYVSYGGSKTWRALFYDEGRPRSKRLGTYPELSVAKARDAAFEFAPDKAIASAKAGTFKKVADEWYEDHVLGNNLTSKREIKRHLDVYVLPRWGKTKIFDIDGDDVLKLVRTLEQKHGAPQADAVLSTIRGITTWYAALHPGTYPSPVVPKMKRDKRTAKEKKRKRALDHDEIKVGGEVRSVWNDRGEIRAVWGACGTLGTYGVLVKLLLLTTQREAKVQKMRWADLSEDGVWTIRAENEGEKGHIGAIQLPPVALALLKELPRIVGNPHVFAVAGGKYFNSFSQRKAELDELLPKEMRAKGARSWRLHDLRRTGRSIMSRIGVPRDIAERVLGHAVPGVESTYDVYDYTPQKNAALQKLADEIALIVDPTNKTNVVPMLAGAAARK